MILSGLINNIIPKIKIFFFSLTILCDVISHFVFDCLFKLNSPETTRHTNFKLGIINYHTKISGTAAYGISFWNNESAETDV